MYEELLARLKPLGQEHLLAFWTELDEQARAGLAREIAEVDFDEIAQLISIGHSHEQWSELANRALPPAAIRLTDQSGPRRSDSAHQLGLAALRDSQVGVIIVAGGQGTRLGFDHAKGMFPIGPLSGATLLQILLEKVLARSRAFRVPIAVYLMTSPATHSETIAYLSENQNFGLPAQDVMVFCQGTMPAVDAQSGKLLLAERDALSLSPDGHGGMLAAFKRSGAMDNARRRGIQHLFYAQVDNPLVSLCDPLFLGSHISAQSELLSQVVAKRTLRDKVGNVVTIDEGLRIIEYSDLNPLPDKILDRRAEDGSPIFWAGSAAIHIFDLSFLERMAKLTNALPFHFASKTVDYCDPATGRQIKPNKPNAIKFERFIFDLLPSAKRAIVFEIDWDRAFAPVKNGPGEAFDTRVTVQRQMIQVAREWLTQAGAQVADEVPVEISPLFAQDARELAERILPGLAVTEPRYFC